MTTNPSNASTRASAGPIRRGSVLVLVVGVLALLAIIALVYATIGQGDRRSASALVTKSRIEDQSQAVSDYLAQVIADSTTAVAYRRQSPVDGSNRQDVRYHPLRDYPGVDPNMLSATAELYRKFDPTGTMKAPWGRNDPVDPRMAVTPWLAATTPTWLNPQGAAPSDPARPYLNETDWAHLSVFTPDGRFVNLANLRGNFGVPSGIGADTISDNLYLVRTTGPGTFQTTLNTENNSGPQADPNTPAHYASRQFGVFRPIGDASVRISDPRNLDNLFADTDGDGCYDARWGEFVDAFRYDVGPDGVAGTGDDRILPAQSVVPVTGQMRLFFAARAIDLSALINVNTATSLNEPGKVNLSSNPREYHTIGLYPSDVDLQRLLTMRDVYHVYGSGYEENSYFAQPQAGNRASNYTQYSNAAEDVGLRAYTGILFSQLLGNVPAGALNPYAVPNGFNALFPNNRLDATSRALLYQTTGRDPLGATLVQAGTATQFAYGSAFGLQELAELLTYSTINDPATTSRLEAAADGRSDAYPQFGPLRSNRPLDIERDANNASLAAALYRSKIDIRHLLTTVSGARPLSATDLPANASPDALLSSSIRLDLQSILTRALGPNPAQADIDAIFRYYADALLPYSAEQRAWDPGNERARAVHYGGARTDYRGNSAELALRTAAHMTANLLASRTRDEEPVLLSLRIAGTPQADTLLNQTIGTPALPRFPGWAAASPQTASSLPGGPRLMAKLDLDAGNTGASRLAPAGYDAVPAQLSALALNIYSASPQPFLTEVASFVMYTDVHEAQGGDGRTSQAPAQPEWQIIPGTGGNPDTIQNNPITINGSVRKANKDFMLEMVSFQVTNPFETDVALTALDAAGNPIPDGQTIADTTYRFYLEFSGRYFKLADYDKRTGLDPKSIILRAGETRVFYVLGQDPEDIATRWRDADPQVPAGAAGADAVINWIESKLRFTNAAGTAVNPIRIMRFDPDTGLSASGSALDEPGVLNPQGQAVPNQPELNRTARLWKAHRTSATVSGGQRNRLNDLLVDRLRDPSVGGRPTLDRRLPQRNTQVLGTLAGPDPTAPESATYPPLDNTGFSITLYASIRRPDNPGTGVPEGAIPAYCIEAKSTLAGHFPSLNVADTLPNVDPRNPKKADFLPIAGAGPHASNTFTDNRRALWRIQQNAALLQSITRRPEARSGNTIARSGPGRAGPEFDRLYVTLTKVRAAGTTSDPLPPLRMSDLLLPLAVGPVHDPAQLTDLDLQWTTLGESLAQALDYDSSANASDLLYALGRHDPATGRPVGAYDRARLRLDAFTPFDDLDNNGAFDPDRGEALRGDGLPPAMKILSHARVQKFGSYTSMISGLININTAPVMAMRMLPLVSPDMFGPWAGVGSRPLFTPNSERYDLAATFEAYRDKTVAFTRPLGNGNNPRAVDFRDANDGSNPVPNANPYTAFGEANGRRHASGIAAIRETPGFAGVGEVLAARLAAGVAFSNSLGAFSLQNDTELADLSIDRFARDDKVLDPLDNSGNSIGLTTHLYGALNRPSQVKDDYAQQLTIADAVLNSISTRSDVFAVWFVVRGYLPGDTEGLGPDDPMVPTLNRRYVMVVDRSNVTARGQKPRILLLQEVPVQ